MERNNLEKYYLSIQPFECMLNANVISKQEYKKIESFIAEKYCIKKNSLYRLIPLTIPRSRVIDSVSKEDVIIDGEKYNQVRRITQVNK